MDICLVGLGTFSDRVSPPGKLRAWGHLVGWGQWSECVARRRSRCSVPSDTPSACLAKGLLVKFGGFLWFCQILFLLLSPPAFPNPLPAFPPPFLYSSL